MDLYPTKTRLVLLQDVGAGRVMSDVLAESDVIWLYPDAPVSWRDPVKVTARIREMERAGWVREELGTWVLTDVGWKVLEGRS